MIKYCSQEFSTESKIYLHLLH
uniref:Uncharacterized protein n=1 Tax=Arundo donax TaxID=35708 RepID=A0A0A9F640_ARUDO